MSRGVSACLVFAPTMRSTSRVLSSTSSPRVAAIWNLSGCSVSEGDTSSTCCSSESRRTTELPWGASAMRVVMPKRDSSIFISVPEPRIRSWPKSLRSDSASSSSSGK